MTHEAGDAHGHEGVPETDVNSENGDVREAGNVAEPGERPEPDSLDDELGGRPAPDSTDDDAAEARKELDRIEALPLPERAAAYAGVHERLVRALDEDA